MEEGGHAMTPPVAPLPRWTGSCPPTTHRIHAVGKDSRFDKVRDKPLLFLQFWTIQGLW